eukprot:gene22543-biopygen13285
MKQIRPRELFRVRHTAVGRHGWGRARAARDASAAVPPLLKDEAWSASPLSPSACREHAEDDGTQQRFGDPEKPERPPCL